MLIFDTKSIENNCKSTHRLQQRVIKEEEFTRGGERKKLFGNSGWRFLKFVTSICIDWLLVESSWSCEGIIEDFYGIRWLEILRISYLLDNENRS